MKNYAVRISTFVLCAHEATTDQDIKKYSISILFFEKQGGRIY